MKRSERKEADKWDLTKFFKTEKEYNALYDKTLDLLKKIVKMKGHITKDDKYLLEFLKIDDELDLCFEQLYVYSYLNHYQDTNAQEGKKYKEKADKLEEKITEETSFVRSELLSVSYDYIKSLVKKNKELNKYSFALEKLFRYEKHTLSQEEERIISLASNAFGTGDNAFSALDNADVVFDKVNIDGKETELNHSNYIKLMNNKNRNVRKKVFETYYKFYVQHKDTISELYKGQLREDIFATKARKFKSPLEMSLYSDAISVDVYTNLINTIHNNLKPVYNYMALRKNFMNLDKLHMYDIYVDLAKGEEVKFSFEEAKDTVLKAVAPLGEQYVSDLKKAFENRWIDRYPNDGKRSGAYQWGSYGVDPYVSLNFEGDEDSVSTLAHELGHAMHSFYSDNNQDHLYAQYPIFLAEIASTVNEVLLNEYFINNAKTDEEKLLYVTSFLDKFRATVYRQVMFAEFEMIMHDKEQNNEVITTDTLTSVYYDLNKLYYGDNVVSDDLIKYEWSRIPHFYTPFYVYKYATGFCAALAIASDILSGKKGAQENYLKFLKSGSSDYPLEILKKCGIDMTTSEPIEKGIKMFEEKISLAKEIMKKVK